MTRLSELERDAVIVACAVSAGIHGALVPEHLAESTGAGLGFLVAAILLGALVVAVTLRPTPATLTSTAIVLAGLLASYALVITTGVPVLHPEPEPVDALALFTKAVEAAALLAAGHLVLSGRPARHIHPLPKGSLT